jgi:aspartate/glutamate racemase
VCVPMGGTDLNVVYKDGAADFPVIDSAAVHADAVAAIALED